MDIKRTEFQLESKLDRKILSLEDTLAFVKRINSCHKEKCIDIEKNKNGRLTFPIHQLSIFETESLKSGYILKQLQNT